ncbi:MAG: Clp protease N-terminal domain-containing protein, partial [Tepidisphaeraceae bacterium]
MLKEFGVDLGAVRQQTEQVAHPPGKGSPPARLQQTEGFRRVLNHAIEEAGALSHNYVGSEHLLLGLLREPEGTAARVLAKMNLKLQDVREKVLNLLGRAPASKDSLLERAMKDLALQLADERVDAAQVRAAAEALINAAAAALLGAFVARGVIELLGPGSIDPQAVAEAGLAAAVATVAGVAAFALATAAASAELLFRERSSERAAHLP